MDIFVLLEKVQEPQNINVFWYSKHTPLRPPSLHPEKNQCWNVLKYILPYSNFLYLVYVVGMIPHIPKWPTNIGITFVMFMDPKALQMIILSFLSKCFESVVVHKSFYYIDKLKSLSLSNNYSNNNWHPERNSANQHQHRNI